MLDRSHPTNKYDVKVARINRSRTIALTLIGALVTLVSPLLANLHPPG